MLLLLYVVMALPGKRGTQTVDLDLRTRFFFKNSCLAHSMICYDSSKVHVFVGTSALQAVSCKSSTLNSYSETVTNLLLTRHPWTESKTSLIISLPNSPSKPHLSSRVFSEVLFRSFTNVSTLLKSGCDLDWTVVLASVKEPCLGCHRDREK